MSETNAHQSDTKRPADEPSEASEAGLRSRRKQTKAEHRACQASGCGVGMGGIIPGGALAGRLLEAELTQKSGAFSCDTNNDQSKTSGPDGAAEPLRPVGWLAEGAACAPARHNPPGGGPLRGRAAGLCGLEAHERCTIFQASQPTFCN